MSLFFKSIAQLKETINTMVEVRRIYDNWRNETRPDLYCQRWGLGIALALYRAAAIGILLERATPSDRVHASFDPPELPRGIKAQLNTPSMLRSCRPEVEHGQSRAISSLRGRK
jgi:hypothetical protein